MPKIHGILFRTCSVPRSRCCEAGVEMQVQTGLDWQGSSYALVIVGGGHTH